MNVRSRLLFVLTVEALNVVSQARVSFVGSSSWWSHIGSKLLCQAREMRFMVKNVLVAGGSVHK